MARKKSTKKTEPTSKTPKKKGGKKKKGLTRAEKLEALMDETSKKFGSRASIQWGRDVQNVFVLRRPTGITSLDIAIGGGMPAGGMTIVAGPEGVGKDYLTNRVICNLQQNYGEDATVALCMTELPYDKYVAKKTGVRIAFNDQEIEEYQRALKRPFTPEEMNWALDNVGHFHHAMASNAEEILEIASDLVESNLYHIVVINSFGALLTKAEEESTIMDKHYGGAAVPITNFMHRMHSALMPTDGEPNRTTIIGINQARDDIGNQWNDIRQSGGWALKHGKLVDIFLRATKRLKGGAHSEIVGKEIHWSINKGKAGCHDGPKGMYPFYFGETVATKDGPATYPFGADVYQDLVIAGVLTGVINQNSSWYDFTDENYNLRAQGAESFSHLLAQTPGIFEYIREKIFQASGTAFIKRENDAQTAA